MVRNSESVAGTGPIRTCIGCRERAAKGVLVRVTARIDEDGHAAVLVDTDGTAPGRGAHLHPAVACYELAVRRKAFARALRLTAQPSGRELSTGSVERHLHHLTEASTR